MVSIFFPFLFNVPTDVGPFYNVAGFSQDRSLTAPLHLSPSGPLKGGSIRGCICEVIDPLTPPPFPKKVHSAQ